MFFQTKWRVILTITVLISCICILFSVLFVAKNNDYLDREISLRVDNIKMLASTLEGEVNRQYSARIKSFVNKTELAEALAQDRRAELTERSWSYLTLIERENPYFSTISWISPDNTVYLRAHRPNDHGDDISIMRPDLVLANKKRIPVSGYKIAKSGLGYRIIQPVYFQKKYLGLVQFGINGNFLLDKIEHRVQIPVCLVFNNQKNKFLTRSKFPLHKGAEFSVQSNVDDVFQQSFTHIDWSLPASRITLNDRHYVVSSVMDLIDYAGDTEAVLFALIDITEQVDDVRQKILSTVALSLVIILLSVYILHTSYGLLLSTILALNGSLEAANVDLELKVEQRTDDLNRKNKILETLSITDGLTQVNNRTKIDEILRYEFEQSRRYKKELSVVLVDIDHFKLVNDTYGHLVGDSVLIEFAALVKEVVRSTDTLGRWGGEEFMIICPSTAVASAVAVAEKARCAVAQHSFDQVGTVTASFGVSELTSRDDISSFLARTDKALYLAKTMRNNSAFL